MASTRGRNWRTQKTHQNHQCLGPLWPGNTATPREKSANHRFDQTRLAQSWGRDNIPAWRRAPAVTGGQSYLTWTYLVASWLHEVNPMSWNQKCLRSNSQLGNFPNFTQAESKSFNSWAGSSTKRSKSTASALNVRNRSDWSHHDGRRITNSQGFTG